MKIPEVTVTRDSVGDEDDTETGYASDGGKPSEKNTESNYTKLVS